MGSRRIRGPFLVDNTNVFTGTGNITVVADSVVVVKKATGAATQVTLPPAPAQGFRMVWVVDGKGDAQTNNITVVGAGTDLIEGAANYLISSNYGAAGFLHDGTEWKRLFVNNWSAGTNLVIPGYLYESATNGITAFAGGGQASATALTSELNRIATVATAADSVKLPASVAGLTVIVANHGANAMQVFGAGTDTIDDVATATGVSQMPSSVVLYICTVAGAWYTEGLATGYAGSGLQTLSFKDTFTAFAGGGQASATALTGMMNRVTTVATAADSVKLPASTAGLSVVIINSGANSMQVFGAGTDTINGVATATGVPQMANSVVVYECVTAGAWFAEGVGSGFSAGFPTMSYVNGLTAFAGGGQGSATALTACINRVTTVATAADSVKLPASAGGMQITATNAAAANSMNVFPATGDAINALAINTAFAVPAGKTATFTCAVAGQWHSVLSA